MRVGPARAAGGAQPRVRLPGRRAVAAGADGGEVQGGGIERGDRRARARDRARRALGLSRRRRGAEGARPRRDRHAGPLRGVRGESLATWRRPPARGPARRSTSSRCVPTPPPTSTPTSRASPAPCGCRRRESGWLREMRTRLEAVRSRVAGRARPRVAFIEWVEPLMAGGNWMPELIEAAGGRNLFGEAGKHSDWMRWEELVAADPEVIVVAPCGYGLARCLEELPLLEARPGWAEVAAVRERPRLLRRRQRLLQPPRPAPRRERGDAGGDDPSGGRRAGAQWHRMGRAGPLGRKLRDQPSQWR